MPLNPSNIQKLSRDLETLDNEITSLRAERRRILDELCQSCAELRAQETADHADPRASRDPRPAADTPTAEA